MTGVLLTTIACLLMLCAVLVALVIGQDRATRRERSRADSAETRCARQRVRIRHQRGRINSLQAEAELLGLACDRLTRRNEELRDQLDARTTPQGGRQMTVEVMAWLADLPVTDPGDLR